MPRQRLDALRTPFFWWVFLLATLIVSGLVAAAFVFTKGLVVTNLTDLVPWGLWIAIDLSSIALSAGAFLLSAAVYLLGLKHLQPVARTAVFIGLIGYSMAVLTLMLDIGRPDRFWHAVAFWNVHSPLWEVTMCVCFYLTVLLLEVLPIFGESDWMQQRWPRLAAKLTHIHHFAPVLAVAGLCLSLLHQSSLGATYGVLKARPIWYRPGLPVLFIVSAMVAGPSMTVLVSLLVARLSSRVIVKKELLHQVSKAIGWLLAAYLYLRFWDALSMSYTYEPARSEGLSMLTSGPLSLNFWMGEMFLGIVLPMIILLSDRLRRYERLHMIALLLVVGGLVAYRWDTNMVGQLVVFSYLPQGTTPQYTRYFPSVFEIMAGLGVIAYGFLAFTLGARYLRVVDHETAVVHETTPTPQIMVAGD